VEDFTVVIHADTSEDHDPNVDYYTSRVFNYVAGDTAATDQVDVAAGDSATLTLTANTQTSTVDVPLGGLSGDATIVIRQVLQTTTSTSTQGSPTYVYDVTAYDSATGLPLPDAAINRVYINIPVDLSVVTPGGLESGVFLIYHGATLAILEAGDGTVVPVENIISSDYVGDGLFGSVTFWVDSLSVFSIGLPAAVEPPVTPDQPTQPDQPDQPSTTPSIGSSGGSCFIDTAADGFWR
jgi:hypothetical protein